MWFVVVVVICVFCFVFTEHHCEWVFGKIVTFYISALWFLVTSLNESCKKALGIVSGATLI